MKAELINHCIKRSDQTLDHIHYLLKKNSIVYYGLQDREIILPKGYFIQVSASHERSFATRYFPKSIIDYKLKYNLGKYPFSFIGCCDPGYGREKFYNQIKNKKSVLLKIYPHRKYLYSFEEYFEILNNSRFVLCPMGQGLQSIRFYETIMCKRVPIFIGNPSTKLPIDWIIDWNKACFRIDINSDYNLDDLLEIDEKEYYSKLEYINFIYHEYLKYEQDKKFLNIIVDYIEKNLLKIKRFKTI